MFDFALHVKDLEQPPQALGLACLYSYISLNGLKAAEVNHLAYVNLCFAVVDVNHDFAIVTADLNSRHTDTGFQIKSFV